MAFLSAWLLMWLWIERLCWCAQDLAISAAARERLAAIREAQRRKSGGGGKPSPPVAAGKGAAAMTPEAAAAPSSPEAPPRWVALSRLGQSSARNRRHCRSLPSKELTTLAGDTAGPPHGQRSRGAC